LEKLKPILEELREMCSNEVNLEAGDHYCSLGNCLRKAWKKRGFSWRCPIHYYHNKFCYCEEHEKLQNPYTGSVFVKLMKK
jgi:hypothetical protein